MRLSLWTGTKRRDTPLAASEVGSHNVAVDGTDRKLSLDFVVAGMRQAQLDMADVPSRDGCIMEEDIAVARRRVATEEESCQWAYLWKVDDSVGVVHPTRSFSP